MSHRSRGEMSGINFHNKAGGREAARRIEACLDTGEITSQISKTLYEAPRWICTLDECAFYAQKVSFSYEWFVIAFYERTACDIVSNDYSVISN